MRNYTDESIVVIYDDVDKIRQSHYTYIGYTDWKAFLHLIKEIIQNSIDEISAGSGDIILVIFDEKTKTVSIIDNCSGIPQGKMIELATILQSSGKFEKGKGRAYGIAAGAHGIGLTATNALSISCTIVSFRDGIKKTCRFAYGHLEEQFEEKCDTKKTGTIVTFTPDESVLGKIKTEYKDVLNLCEIMTYLSKVTIKATITTKNGKDISETYKSKNGIMDLLNKIAPDSVLPPIYIKANEGQMGIEVAFVYVTESPLFVDGNEFILSYANFCTTIDHGEHVNGFRQGIGSTIPKIIKDNFLNKKELNSLTVTADDARTGLIAVVNATHENAFFDGQIKSKLGNKDIAIYARSVISKGINEWFKKNEKDAKKLADYVKTMARIRINSTKERKTAIKKSGFDNAFSGDKPKGWHPCTNKKAKNKILYIVEGKSAAGSADQGRDKEYMEIYELRGVILNTINASMTDLLDNDEIKGLITIIGTGIGKDFKLEDCRYDMIVILTDSDSDGNKITSLLSVLFYFHMRGLVEAGIIYKAIAPLYRVMEGKKEVYLTDKRDYAKYVQKYISKELSIDTVIGKQKSKLKSDDIIELMVDSKRYLDELIILSNRIVCLPQLVEFTAINYHLIVNDKINKFQKLLKNKFEFMNIESDKQGIYMIEGYAEKEFQLIKLKEKTLFKLGQLNNEYKKLLGSEDIVQYSVNGGAPITLYELLELFKTYEPKNRQRYKGLITSSLYA